MACLKLVSRPNEKTELVQERWQRRFDNAERVPRSCFRHEKELREAAFEDRREFQACNYLQVSRCQLSLFGTSMG